MKKTLVSALAASFFACLVIGCNPATESTKKASGTTEETSKDKSGKMSVGSTEKAAESTKK